MDFIDDDSGDEREELDNTTCDRRALLSQRPESCGILQFHSGIEEAFLLYVERNAKERNPESVLRAADKFCYSRHWMMHVGDEKGTVLDTVIRDVVNANDRPIVCVEIGSYCGYSAVRIASHFTHPSSKLYSIEIEPNCVQWTQRMVTLAQLSDRVTIIEGNVSRAIAYLLQLNVEPVDILFIDHDKKLYLRDLMAFENSGLLRHPGGVVVADNVLCFNSPLDDYLRHVRCQHEDTAEVCSGSDVDLTNLQQRIPCGRNVHYASSILHRCSLEYSCPGSADIPKGDYLEDGVEISIIGSCPNTAK